MKKYSKVNNTIAQKISKKMTLQSFGRILAFYIVLLLVFTGYILYDSNRDMKNFSTIYSKEDVLLDSKILLAFNYTLEVRGDRNSVITFSDANSLSNIIKSTEYNYLMSESDEEFVYITKNIGKEINVLKNAMLILLFIELVGLLDEHRKSKKKIDKIMEPLEEIISAAQVINQTADLSKGSLKNLAGMLDSINERHLEIRLPVDSEKTELSSLSVAINDMLDRIDKAYSSQSRFVSDASHELRTPIAIIQGYANLLNRWGIEDEETTKEAISAIKIESENMKNMVEQLLFLARGDNETIFVKNERIDLRNVVEQNVQEMRMIDNRHNFVLDIKESAEILGDLGLIKQLIRIFIDNSIKYSHDKGDILIKVYVRESRAIFHIQDEGEGISSQELPQVFERFYRTDKSRSRNTGGSGLGLSIAKWIVEKHGGHITVLSREAVGTRMEVELPLA